MNRFILTAFIALAMGMNATEANAQKWLQKIQKINKVLDTANAILGGDSTATMAAFSSSGAVQGSNGIPGFEVTISSCRRMGSTVWLEYVIKNTGADDRTAVFYNSMDNPHTQLVVGGRTVEPDFIAAGKIMNSSTAASSSTNFPAGIPIKLTLVASASASTKAVDKAVLSFGANQYLMNSNIPITEVSGNTSSDNLKCEYPDITVKYVGSTRSGNVVSMKYQLTNTSGSDMDIEMGTFSSNGGYVETYGSDGTLYESKGITFSNSKTGTTATLPADIPVTMTAKFTAPTTVKQVPRMKVCIKRWGIPFNITHTNVSL